MADRTLPQVHEAASQNQEVLGYDRECGSHPDKRGHHNLLFGGDCTA